MGTRSFRRGGIHPPEEKHWTAEREVEPVALPERLFVPLSQHIGAPAKLAVKKGDRVLAGQVLATPAGFVSVPIHAPTSGTVRGIDLHPHPLGTPQPAVEIEADGDDAWGDPLEPFADPFSVPPEQLRRRILDAGIVGMGGAAFPTHVKLSPPPEMKINAVILNGVECEPYLTADHRLMLEHPDQILSGLDVILHLFGLEKGTIGIERNKPDAIRLMTERARPGGFAEVVPLKVKFPQGAEKQLIQAVLRREVPSGALPMAVGAVVQNVGTAAAIWAAVHGGRPLVERIVTVTGPSVVRPGNLRVRVGTPLSHLIEACGGLRENAGQVISGGPMMGLTQHDLAVPVIKGTSGVLCLPVQMVRQRPAGACIRCGRCVSVCPMGLSPTNLATLIAHDRVAETDDRHALDCIECGSCAFICPAEIPLVQSIRWAKGRVLANRRQRNQAA
ncbi:MAG TPA: electron transport complex subunit RsxC [Deferrisomatales bacterium]|nr:electron transport complex subunit RsxC [Deferrisomatales bacterium]